MTKRCAEGDPEGVPEPKRACAPQASVFALLEAERAGVGGDIMLRCMYHWLVESNDLHQARAALHLRAASTAWHRAWTTVFNRDVFPTWVKRNAKFAARIEEWMAKDCPSQTAIFTVDYSTVSALQISSYLLLCVNADPYTPPFLRELRAKSIREMVAPRTAKESDDQRLSHTWENQLRIMHGDIMSLALLQQCSYLGLAPGVEDLLQQKIVPWYKNMMFRERTFIAAFMAR